MEVAINGSAFSLVEILIWVVVAAICAGIAQAIVGFHPGGLLMSIVVGLLGAALGSWLARQLGLPAILTISVNGTTIELLWTILGSALLVLLLSLVRRRPVVRRYT